MPPLEKACRRAARRSAANIAFPFKSLLALVLWSGLGHGAIAVEPPGPAKALELDAFTSGPWQGANAVFQSANFDAVLGADRVLRIQPKENGKNVGAPVLVRFNAYYVDDLKSIGRDLVSLEKRPAPAMQPRRVELAGHYQDKVRFAISFQFSDRGITVDGTIKDPPGLKLASTFAYAAYFSATHQIPKETPPEEIKKQTAGYSIKLTDGKRQSRTMEFWEISATMSGAMAVSEVVGGWGSRRVIVETPASRASGNRWGNLGNYYSTPFYQGSWYISRGGGDKIPPGPLTVRVE